MTDVENITLEAELPNEEAEREIAKAVSARHAIARKYVKRVRKRNPDATPVEVITMLERHHVAAITIAGGIVSAGSIAAAAGIALVPGGGAATAAKTVSAQDAKKAGKVAAKKAGKVAAKKACKEAAKALAKGVALNAGKTGAQRAVALLPAGDEQLQSEITGTFALAIADIHGMDLDRDQARALDAGQRLGAPPKEYAIAHQVKVPLARPCHSGSPPVKLAGRFGRRRPPWLSRTAT
ncbi:hypothetical protein NLX85_17850 [Micromonospora sp. A3M-1-15]|uniref:hypothetical protein n=1 Tax=Micromonospora sp. A3M-1-15 TaxID=2962035 RepID=UPI0020B6A9D9|nr:hypothetical protein [Micromonospora sp. A3M-1-15]MCP3785232.1 hypothetical protein [Micromonospora sp. A3M-1-15]